MRRSLREMSWLSRRQAAEHWERVSRSEWPSFFSVQAPKKEEIVAETYFGLAPEDRSRPATLPSLSLQRLPGE